MRCPSCTGGCISLTSLAAGFCRNLMQLPGTVSSMSNLASLDLQWCEALERLPAFGQQQRLWRLQVHSGLRSARAQRQASCTAASRSLFSQPATAILVLLGFCAIVLF